MKLNGPLKNDYIKADNYTSTTTNWSPCGTSGENILTLEVTLDAKDPKGSSEITVSTNRVTRRIRKRKKKIGRLTTLRSSIRQTFSFSHRPQAQLENVRRRGCEKVVSRV